MDILADDFCDLNQDGNYVMKKSVRDRIESEDTVQDLDESNN